MAYIYAYAPDATDCSTAGLVGALLDEDAAFEQQAGEFGELSFTHPIDEWGKWRALAEGVLLKTEVPVRLCPEIVNGTHVASVDVYTVSAAATKAQRYVYSKSVAGARKDKKKKLLKVGTRVTVTLDVNPGDGGARCKVRAGKVTGYMEKAGLALSQASVAVSPTHAGLEAVEASYAVRQQLFRVYEVAPQSQAGKASGVRVRARRIIYDLLGDNCHYVNRGNLNCQTAINGVLGSCAWAHDFSGHTDIGDSHLGFDARDMNLVKALIDPEEGVAARWGAEVAVDDYDIYLLRRCGVDRGVRIEYGKNLTGIRVEADSSGAVTAVRPVGENADGSSLYLDGHVVNGRHGYNYARGTCANWLPSGYRFLTNADGSLRDGSYVTRASDPPFAVHRCAAVKCSDARVDEKKKQKTGVSVAVARVRMANQAVEKFAAGCDSVQLSMGVDFVLLGDTEEYRQYKGLEPLFVYDTVHVRHAPLGIRADVNLTRFKWLVRAERVSEADFGVLRDASASIASWQLPNGLSGAKIAPGSLSGRQLDDDSIEVRHLQADSVNAEAIQAEAVTAGKLAAGAVTAGTIEAGAVNAAALAAQSVTAEKLAANAVTAAAISAQAVTAEKLAANAVDAQALSAVTAAIQNLAAADISTSGLYAAFAHLISLAANSVAAGTVSADALASQLARIVSLSAQIADVDYASVKDLAADAAIITDGEAGALRIERLAVTSANLLNAVIGSLVLTGTDGNYYAVRVGSDGGIETEAVTVTAEEIVAGETSTGRQIVADAVNAYSLNGASVSASQAILGTVLANALTAGKITAGEAVVACASIPALYTTAITSLGNSLDLTANQSVNLLVGGAQASADAAQATADAAEATAALVRGVFSFDTDGLRTRMSGSKWSTLTAEDGFYIDHDDVPGHVGAFYQETFEPRSMRMGDVIARRTATGGWSWKKV